MSNTRNVKLGVCKVSLNGQDLGYTKGGVDVTVKTNTHKVEIDQFGQTPINEYIMGRDVTVKVPLAETTIDNMVAIMPGAQLVTNGVAATGTVTVTTNPTAGMNIVLNGLTVTFETLPTGVPYQVAVVAGVTEYQVEIGTAATNTAANIAAFINWAAVNGVGELGNVSASAATDVVTITYNFANAYGNNFTLASGTAGADVTVSGTTLTGGTDGTFVRVDVPTGVGTSLLDFAVPLTLHPIALPANDLSEDFTVYKAATAGALNFAYDFNKERVFDVDFNGYPDEQGRLFGFGDANAPTS